MTELMNLQAEALTMSSVEIAHLVESRHDNVKRTVERLVGRGVISHPPMEDGPKSSNGVVTKVYAINKRDSYVIVAQLSPEFTARLVDRWQELEQQQLVNQVPQTLPEALRLAAELAEDRQRLALENKALTSDVARLQVTANHLADQLAVGITPPQFVKQLNGVNSQQVNKFLFSKGWLIEQCGEKQASSYARDRYLKQEWFEHKIAEGMTRQRSKVVLTRKGAKWLYKAYVAGDLPMKGDWDGQYTHVLFEDAAGPGKTATTWPKESAAHEPAHQQPLPAKSQPSATKQAH